ncbi:MAG: hypothetical protein HYT87_06730 [Nitrospirae bacterium]|nr:hypothetical protein [Nitrospirota bacterium]
MGNRHRPFQASHAAIGFRPAGFLFMAVLGSLALPVTGSAVEARLKGYAKTALSRDLRDDSPREDYSQNAAKVFAEAKLNAGESSSLVLSGKLRYDVFLSRRLDPKTEGAVEAGLHELYGDFSRGDLDARIGYQTMTWAENLLLSPIDTLNPPDIRTLLDPDSDELKLPLLAAKLQYYPLPDLKLEGVWIPFFREAGFDLFARDQAMLKHETITVEAPGELLILGDDPQSIFRDPQLQHRANSVFKATDFPEDDLSASELGARATFSLDPLSAAASYFYTHDDLPAVDANPALVRFIKDAFISQTELLQITQMEDPFRMTFPRHHEAGISLNATLLDTNLGMDTLYTSRRAVYDRDLARFDRADFTFGVGGDRVLFSNHVMIGLEALGVWFPDLPKQKLSGADLVPVDLLLIRNPLYTVIGLARLMLLDEDLTIEARALALPSFGESLWTPRCEYTFSDQWKAFAAATYFVGKPGKLLGVGENDPLPDLHPIGYLKENSNLILGLKYLF